MQKKHAPQVHFYCQDRRRLIPRRTLRWCCVWIAGSQAITTRSFLFANGAPVVAIAGESPPNGSSFDFIVSGAKDRLKGLTVASVLDEDSTDEERGSGAKDADGEIKPTGVAVVDAPDSAIGVHRDDHIIAVNGVPISHLSLSDWIKDFFSAQSDTTVAAAARVASSLSHPQSTRRMAMFPLVDAQENNLMRPLEGSFVFPSPSETLSGNNCHLAAGSDSPTLCSSTQSDPTMRNGVRAMQTGGSDSSLLTGFIRVEVVELPKAEVTFRPGEVRQVEIIRQREEEAVVAERRERDRLIVEEKALLESRKKEMEQEEDERRVSREMEAEAKAAKKSKEEIARMREEGIRFIFTAEFKEVGLPMGLAFDRASPLTIVSEVVAGSLSEAAGVRVGDHLVRVNDQDSSELKPAMAIKLLQRAEWPRVLTFSAPETEATEADDEPLFFDLVVTEPAIVRGTYLIQVPRKWGSLAEDRRLGQNPWSCQPRPMMLADQALACQQDVRLTAEENELGGRDPSTAIVLVKRGVCTFVGKAKNVQLAIQRLSEKYRSAMATPSTDDCTSAVAVPGGVTDAVPPQKASIFGAPGGLESRRRGGMLLLNGDDALVDMPAGNLVTDDLRIQVAMVSQSNGSSVETLLSWGVEVNAAIVPVGACPLQDTPVHAGAKARKDGDDGGLFRVHSRSAGAADFDYRQAHYGPGVVGVAGRVPRGIAVADPLDGCDDKAYKVRVSGMFAAVERGRCSFNMKTLAAQRAGAVGVIIINTAETTIRVMADRGDGQKATIPTVMVSAKAGRWLLAHAAERDRSPILGRFVRESFDAERG